MKVIIEGSRDRDMKDVAEIVHNAVVASGWEDRITEVVHRASIWVGIYAGNWAEQHGVPVRWFSPDYFEYGGDAEAACNCEMAAYADALIAVWDGVGRGAADLIDKMRALGKPVFVTMTGDGGER